MFVPKRTPEQRAKGIVIPGLEGFVFYPHASFGVIQPPADGNPYGGPPEPPRLGPCPLRTAAADPYPDPYTGASE